MVRFAVVDRRATLQVLLTSLLPRSPPKPEGVFAHQADLNARCKRGGSSLSLRRWKTERREKLLFCVIRGGQVVLCFSEPWKCSPNVSPGCSHGLGLQEGRT